MRVADVDPAIFAALDDQRTQSVARSAFERLSVVMTPSWIAEMEAKVRGVVRENASAASKLKKITDLMDETSALRAPHVVCKSGCSACCHMQVEMTDVEADRIAHATGVQPRRFAPGRHTTPMDALGRRDTPCTFLVENQCSIYDVRPVVCRDMAVAGPDALACSFENMALAREHDPRMLSVPQASMRPVLLAWMEISTSRRPAFADIRQFFPDFRSDD